VSLSNGPIYQCSILENDEIKRQIQELLQKGHIHLISSPYGSLIVMVQKKDGTWRLCIDYRALNKITVRNRYPIPWIDDLLGQLKVEKYFSEIELKSRYHQVPIEPSDVWKTAFEAKEGLFEWLVMHFVLTNAPTTFMRLMDDILRPFTNSFVVVYLDDILILQPELGRAPPPHPKGSPNTAATQAMCQFGEILFWHDPGSISGIHY